MVSETVQNGAPNGVHAKASKASRQHIVETGFEKVPVTKILAEFVADLAYDSIPSEVIQNMKGLLLDNIGIGAYGAAKIESSEPFHRAILAFSGNATGPCSVMTKGQNYLPQHAALLNAAYSHTLDFDDTYKTGILHPGAPLISAALAQAEASGASGKTLLTGLVAGYEVICRISRALGSGAADRGFHNTGTAGIFGAIAAIMKVRGESATAIEDALGLACSKAAGSQQFLENGAWNKRLHPGFAAHDAFLCIAFVDQGIKTAVKPLEGVFGFLKAYSNAPSVDKMVDGLGKEWLHLETALKPYPGCRMTHTGIDLAGKWRKEKTCEVKSLRLSLAPHCWMIVGRPIPNKIHPKNIVDAQFSAYYQTAVTWLHGNQLGWGLYDLLEDKEVSTLIDRITVDEADDLEGWAGRLQIHWEDGTSATDTEQEPLGEPSNPFKEDQLRGKFRSMTQPVYGEEKAGQIEDLIMTMEKCSDAKKLMTLLA